MGRRIELNQPLDRPTETSSAAPLQLAPVPRLLERLRRELNSDFLPGRPTRISSAPGRLDVMGGIADYTGSLVCEMPLQCAAALALQPRDDRQLQIFSFNLLDEHRPFVLRISLDALASATPQALQRDFADPTRRWAAYIAGVLFILHENSYVDLASPAVAGMNLAILSDVPMGAGVSSSAAIEVATIMNFIGHFVLDSGAAAATRLRQLNDPLEAAALCQQVENRIVGAPCGIMDQVTSLLGRSDSLLRMVCQPHQVQPPLRLPANIRVIGIDSAVKHSVGGGAYGRTRCAAFMGHRIILDKMIHMAQAGGRELQTDPMNGYLANLDPDDYKRLFRPLLPVSVRGLDFLEQYGPTIDRATSVAPDRHYHVQQATDHHVLEAQRVRRFAELIEQAAAFPANSHGQRAALEGAGRLMYASHVSYTKDAMLGADECDLIVELVRASENSGLYGAKITGGGSGGTVAILADRSEKTNAVIAQIMAEYARRTGNQPNLFTGSRDGAWHVGSCTAVI